MKVDTNSETWKAVSEGLRALIRREVQKMVKTHKVPEKWLGSQAVIAAVEKFLKEHDGAYEPTWSDSENE